MRQPKLHPPPVEALPSEWIALLTEADQDISRLERENPYRLYEFLHSTVRRFMPVDAFYVCLYSEANQALFFAYNAEGNIYDAPVTLPLGEGPTSQAIKQRQPIVWNTEREARSCGGIMFGQMEQFTLSAMHVPIRAQVTGQEGDASIIGVISAQTYQDGAYSLRCVQALQWLADRAGMALTRERDEAAWRYRLKAADAQTADRLRPLLAMAEDFVVMLRELSQEAEQVRRLLPPDADQSLVEAVTLFCRSCNAAQTNANQLPLRYGPAPISSSILSQLTPGERTVLKYLASGYPNKAIASALGVRENTIKSQCKSIFGKLGVSTRTAAARLWLDAESCL